MPVFQLPEEPVFPPPELAESDGLLAVGGDLSEKRLLLAYTMGIFPWYSEGSPILWWSPDPRLVLFPRELKVSRSLRQTITKELFTITVDRAFDEVIKRCAEVHRNRDGDTWITEEMRDAYTHLHRRGFAHSVESWQDGELVGGLYGVALGAAFFGESMFSTASNASKVALVALVERLLKWGYKIIDCQVRTEHLRSLGAREIRRDGFLALLSRSIKESLEHEWK